jgi:predicted metalloprotease with PDZ domain
MNREDAYEPMPPSVSAGAVPAATAGARGAEPRLDPVPAPRNLVQIHYAVAMPEPESHLFEVTLRVTGWTENLLDLKMPVWTPGSYLVREYARHLQDFAAYAGATTQALPWGKVSKNHWQIHCQGNTDLTITYRIFANELTVRTNHLDSTHGYFNGAALFFRLPGYEQCPITVEIAPPRTGWRIATALPPSPGQPHHFRARDFDTLVDSPVEVGQHQHFAFNAGGKPHELAIWGTGNFDPSRLVQDFQRIVEVESALFGGLPYDRYLFLLHLAGQGFGGLEHKDSCTLVYSRFSFRQPDKYHRFMQLVAHEFFHLWNVKRIRPKALEVFDYEQENYTPSLWFCEGTTSYYDLVIPLRAGIYDVRTYLAALSQEISRFLTTPGRRVQPLAESSFDAWIKLYRPDANSPNTQMSYYLKGEMVSLLLDLLIRVRSGQRRSLDDVMRQMWHQFGKAEVGYTPEQLQQVLEAVAETDLTELLSRFLETTEELPFDEYLAPFGLRLKPDGADQPYLGLTLKIEGGREVIKFVEAGSPAQRAGLDAGDELLALDGIRVSAEQWGDRLRDYQPGDTVQVTFFHQDELRSRSLTLATPQPTRYQLVPVDYPTADQERNFVSWLGVSLTELVT